MEDNEQDPFFEDRDLPQSREYDEKRLEYSKPVYRDVYCAIIYHLVLALVIGYGVWVIIEVWPQIQENAQNIVAETEENAPDNAQAPDDYTGVIVSLVSCAAIGLLFGFIWLQILRAFASFLVKVMMILSCLLWITITVIAFIYDEIELGIILAIFTLFMLLYTWCVWSRIAFASVLLALGSRIVGNYSGVVCVQFTVVLFSIFWFGVIMFLLYVIGEYKASGWEWIFAGLILSLFWTVEVNNNISHTTACGVSAVWYFTASDKQIRGPTYKAFNRCMTTSFGSICLGSLLVAILEFIRALVNAALRDSNNCLACMVRCCLACIDACVRWFNKYAYAHCAIYGVSFMKAASQTWRLFEKEGIMALINDDLSGLGLFAGDLCAFVVCGGVGYGIAYSFYGSDPNTSVSQDLVWGLAVFSAIIGAVLCWMVLVVVRSAIVTLFVCFAEEPAILYANRREDFNKIAEVQPKFQEIHDNLASSQGV